MKETNHTLRYPEFTHHVNRIFPVSYKRLEALLNTLMSHSGPMPYLIVFFLLLACGFGLPMPEDIILFAAGMMAFYGAAPVEGMIAICFSGVLIGDTIVYTFARFYGRKIRRTKFMKWLLPPPRMRIVRHKLHQQGNKVIFAARFMPGLRMPVYFSSGLLHLPFKTFLFYDGLAALISVPTIVYATYHFGAHVDRVKHVVKRMQFGVIGTIVVIVAMLVIKNWWNRRKELEIALAVTKSEEIIRRDEKKL